MLETAIPRISTAKELKRLAEATGGLYVSAQDAYGDAMLGNLNDGVHPNPAGHKLVADLMLSLMTGEEAPTLSTTTEPTQAPVIGSYARVYDAPVTDPSLWMVTDGGSVVNYDEAKTPALDPDGGRRRVGAGAHQRFPRAPGRTPAPMWTGPSICPGMCCTMMLTRSAAGT